jgi:hypothetical protein
VEKRPSSVAIAERYEESLTDLLPAQEAGG